MGQNKKQKTITNIRVRNSKFMHFFRLFAFNCIPINTFMIGVILHGKFLFLCGVMVPGASPNVVKKQSLLRVNLVSSYSAIKLRIYKSNAHNLRMNVSRSIIFVGSLCILRPSLLSVKFN